jgi:hypothetical protein
MVQYGNMICTYGTIRIIKYVSYDTYNTVSLRRIFFLGNLYIACGALSCPVFAKTTPFPPPQKKAPAAKPLLACNIVKIDLN